MGLLVTRKDPEAQELPKEVLLEPLRALEGALEVLCSWGFRKCSWNPSGHLREPWRDPEAQGLQEVLLESLRASGHLRASRRHRGSLGAPGSTWLPREDPGARFS